MSANEVLEQVKALPARERRKFFESVHEFETADDARPLAGRKIRTRWPNAAARRRKITGGKTVPNLVLLSREQERYEGEMSLYADTSLLISYYVNDSNSATAQAIIHATNEPLIFTGLHRLEIRNALALGVFRKILKPAQINAAWVDIERDLRQGRLNPQHANWGPVFRAAAQSAAFHCPVVGCRSLDVLHVALAKSVNAKEFLTFDTRQRSLAVAQGMTVRP